MREQETRTKRWKFSINRKVIELARCSTYDVPAKKNALQVNNLQSVISIFCDPAGTRTQGPNIKSVVLYQLSYEINTTHLTLSVTQGGQTGCKNTGTRLPFQKKDKKIVHTMWIT